MSHAQIQQLREKWGIVFDGCRDFTTSDEARRIMSRLAAGAMDAALPVQQGLITSPNAAIPALFTTFMDPELTRVLVAPTKAAEIFGEAKKGDWEDTTIGFPMVEVAGETSAYGDDNENGTVDANANWEYRQPFMYQTITHWGDLEVARAAKAKLSWVSEQNIASAEVMRLYENVVYFFGVAGLQNYGLLNDPILSAPIVPSTKAAGGTTWAKATTKEIYQDFLLLFKQLQVQSGGLIEATDELVAGMSPESEVWTRSATDFNVSAWDMIQKAFPKLKIVSAVQYATASGQLVQMIAPKVMGQKTGYCSFTEKMRAHRIVEALSSYKQKKSAGVSGAIIRQGFAIAQMLGV